MTPGPLPMSGGSTPRCAGWATSTTVQATEVVPGLILIAPTDGESFVPGIYRIGVQGRKGNAPTRCASALPARRADELRGRPRSGRVPSGQARTAPAAARSAGRRRRPRRRRHGAGRPEALGHAGPEVAAVPSVAPSVVTSAPVAPSESPGEGVDPLALPTWSDVAPVVTRHPAWGIRTIVAGETPAPDGSSAGGVRALRRALVRGHRTAGGLSGGRRGLHGPVVALGITFPPEEAPLDVRIWKRSRRRRAGVDGRAPGGRRPGARREPVRPARRRPARPCSTWEPGQYRADVLVGGRIKRIDIDVTTTFGDLPLTAALGSHHRCRAAWIPPRSSSCPRACSSRRGGERVDPVRPVPSSTGTAPGWTSIARSRPRVRAVRRAGVPTRARPISGSSCRPSRRSTTTDVQRLAPSGDSTDGVRQMALGSAGSVSFVAFAPRDGSAWKPGVYALTVAWDDADGDARRNVARRGPAGTGHGHAGAPGRDPSLVEVRRLDRRPPRRPESLSGSDPLGVTLLEITPQDRARLPGPERVGPHRVRRDPRPGTSGGHRHRRRSRRRT